MDVLNKKERRKIFELFLNNNKFKFNEIEKHLGIRSNMVSYHLEQMVKEGILVKEEMYYSLTKEAEKFIPIFEQLFGKDLGPLPVVLVSIINDNKILMVKRNKRPYKNYWSMVGGKILFDETFESCSVRQVKEKTSLDSKFISVNHVLHEVVEDEGIKHSFILFFTKVEVDSFDFKNSEIGELRWFDIDSLDSFEKEIIPSDFWLLKNKLDSKMDFDNASMKDVNDKLTDFRVV